MLGAATLALGGCASYQPNPLPEHASLAQGWTRITVERARMPLPELAAHAFNANGRLDMDDIAMLAVVNNPDLRLARDDAGVAHAQAFAAGLLPDPQIALTRDFPHPAPAGTTSAFNLNLSEDINALIRHQRDSEAAREDTRKADLNLLWQEWQVVARARSLYVKLVYEQRLMGVLGDNRALFDERYRRTQAALERGLLTLDAVTPHLTALQDVERQIRDLERQLNADRHDLNALLGLAPEVALPLDGTAELPPLDEAQVLAVLPQLPRRRPDLIALQHGWRAEDQRLRAAIIGQFPTFTVGFTRARDTSGTYTTGFGIALSLPIFNRNRGNIAIEEATRQRLHDEYQTRLNAAHGDVHRILAEQRINARQLGDVERALRDLSQAAARWDLAFRARQIDALVYAGLQSALLAKRIERINLEQSMLMQRVALQTLVGGELPQATSEGSVK